MADYRTSLDSARANIDTLYATRPPAEQFWPIGNQVSAALTDAQREMYDDHLSDTEKQDAKASIAYEWARIDQLAALYPSAVSVRDRLVHAKHQLRDAVQASQRGSRTQLSLYEAELAAFEKRHPDV